MTLDDARRTVVAYWTEKATEALASAEAEHAAGRLSFAVNRAYYACFYALSSVLLGEDLRFVKHSGVRAALHRSLVKTGRLEARWGRFYDRVFENRQRGDYQELVTFEAEQTAEIIAQARGFVAEMHRLLDEAPMPRIP
ncbi:MAG: HEPN domain-containing protein [Deferrisomatales bacterium]|nr:HEPN domain-containing protein [Deferrisomatales bacterium]